MTWAEDTQGGREKQLPGPVLDWIGGASDERRIEAGVTLIAEGQAGAALYLPLEGVFDLVKWEDKKLGAAGPGGRVIAGNFHPQHPAKEFLDYVLDGNLKHRTEEDMNRLFNASAFRRSCSRIFLEAGGINLVAECTRNGGQP